jgi:exonuclease V gamma subunit
VPLLSGARLEPVVVDRILGDGTRITGLIRNLWPTGQVEWAYSKLGSTSELRLWIRHVVLNWAAPNTFRDQHLVGGPKDDDRSACAFGRPKTEAILQRLLYRRGSSALALLPEILPPRRGPAVIWRR